MKNIIIAFILAPLLLQGQCKFDKEVDKFEGTRVVKTEEVRVSTVNGVAPVNYSFMLFSNIDSKLYVVVHDRTYNIQSNVSGKGVIFLFEDSSQIRTKNTQGKVSYSSTLLGGHIWENLFICEINLDDLKKFSKTKVTDIRLKYDDYTKDVKVGKACKNNIIKIANCGLIW